MDAAGFMNMKKPPNSSCHAKKKEEKKPMFTSTSVNTHDESVKELGTFPKDMKLESTKDEIKEIKDENQRLKTQLSQILKDYEELHTKFFNIVQQQKQEQSNANSSSNRATFESHEIVCDLSLGRTSNGLKKDDKKQKSIAYSKEYNQDEGLTLGLECKYDQVSKIINESSPNLSPENSSELVKKEDNEQSWFGAVTKKTTRSGEVDEDLQQNPMKKARVCVRVRCDTPTMIDGCQWRKYGQKIAKGNPCPRAYYRCTVAPSCPVRKQVQRCVDDMSILITTYEGTHNHPLSVSATTMASTTSAALSMLMSGSKTSNPTQSYMSNSSLSTSTSSSHPTITLDLTSSSTNKISPNFLSTTLPKYSSTNLNFSSFESNPMPILNYGNNLLSHSSLSFGGRQISPQENFYNPSFMQNPNPKKIFTPDNVAAATRAITSDPSFHSALATALTSIMGSRNASGGGDDKGNHDQISTTMMSSFLSNNFSSNYVNIPTHPSSNNTQSDKSLSFLQSSSSFSTTKSKSTSPSDNTRDHIV